MPSLEEFIRQVRHNPRTPFLVKDLIPSQPGYSILAGPTGIGKSNLVLQLLMSVSTGSDWLGFPTGNPCNVSYLGFEGGKEGMCDRLEKVQRFNPNGALSRVSYDIIDGRKLAGNEDWFRHHAECDTKRIDLLALDPLKFLMYGDYTKPSDAARFLEKLKAFHNLIGAHIILPHHIRKRDPRGVLEPGDLDEIKGAGDYCDHADCVMLLEREKQQRVPGTRGFLPARRGYFTLYIAKARFNPGMLPEPITLWFNPDAIRFEVDNEPRI